MLKGACEAVARMQSLPTTAEARGIRIIREIHIIHIKQDGSIMLPIISSNSEESSSYSTLTYSLSGHHQTYCHPPPHISDTDGVGMGFYGRSQV